VSKNSVSYPKVKRRKDGKYFIEFKLNGKRYRLFSGNKIGLSINPNSHPPHKRRNIAKDLAKEIYDFLIQNNYSFKKIESKVYLFDSIISKKLNEPLSIKYLKKLKNISNAFRDELVKRSFISIDFIDSLILKYDNSTSYNTQRRHVNVIINYLIDNDFKISPSKLKYKKQDESLNKPIDKINELLEEIKSFNTNLYLCCLITYGCLLRPHREVRELKWSDFSSDFSYIKLSGKRIKSKFNRVVPIPLYIRDNLKPNSPDLNIFSGTLKPLNKDYFKTLWSRFKHVSKVLKKGQTLYSFRHTGAIEIYKRTNSIYKVQKAMGHSSINVTLTYLRGLEIPELKEEDMPKLSFQH